MSHAMLFAGVIALVALAFGKGAAVVLARVIVIVGAAGFLFLAFMIISQRL